MKTKLLLVAAAVLLGTLIIANAAFASNFHCYVFDGRMVCCTTTGNMTTCF